MPSCRLLRQDMETDEKPIEPIEYHWEIVRQGALQTHFTDTYFLSTQKGWAVGGSGIILHTTDGGKTWQLQQSGVPEALQRIVFVDENHGWIGGQGVLLRTENGGKSWQVIREGDLQPSRSGARSYGSIRAIHFIDPKQGWVGVDRGQILRTTDGGKTWTPQQTGTTQQSITDLHFINSKEGWAVAPQRRTGGLILHTVDGGDYWEIQAKTHQRCIGVHFLNATSGWVIMENGTSLLTTDGGESWKRDLEAERKMKGTYLDIQLQTVKFRNHAEAWGIGIGGMILTTQNQGKSWKPLHTSSRGETENSEPVSWVDRMAHEQSNPLLTQITNAYFLADGHGWAVGAERIYERNVHRADSGGTETARKSGGQIYATTDGGKTWHHQFGEAPDNFRDVIFLDEQNGWIAGDNGVLLSTEDGGENWKRLESGTTDRLVDVHFISLDPKWGWAMKRDGSMLYTLDGENWSIENGQELPSGFDISINEVAFGNFSEGWAVGENGDILHNLDGGPIWEFQRTSTGRNLTDIDMKFAPLGWAVGTNGVIQRTVNGGEYWKFHETYAGYDLYGVSFITKRKGWAVGRAGIILSTSDGGFTWESRLSGMSETLYDILALSEQELYAVGAAGTIIHSTDGGETWKREHTGIDNDLYTITRVKEGETLWVVGQGGVVLRH